MNYSLKEILDYLNKVIATGDEIPLEKFEEIILRLAEIVDNQSKLLTEIRNSNIRLENRLKYIETELVKCQIYKNIVETLIEKLNKNPILGLIYLYKIRANIKNFHKQ